MPQLEVEARIIGHPQYDIDDKTQFRWGLTIGGYYRIREPKPKSKKLERKGKWKEYSIPYTGETFGTESWVPSFPQIVGGWGRIIATAYVPDAEDGPWIESEPRWIDICGTNPDPVDVRNFIRTNGRKEFNTILKIMCWERGRTWQQFREYPCGGGLCEGKHTEHEPKDSRCPYPTPKAYHPAFGADPAGIGIAQLDPAPFPDKQWNWQSNVQEGINRYYHNSAGADSLHDQEQERLNIEAAEAEVLINTNRAKQEPPLPPISIERIKDVPDLSTVPNDAILREKVRRYNGGPGCRNYRFDAYYVVNKNDLDFQKPEGNQKWIRDPGRWENIQSWRKRGGVLVRRKWIKVADRNKNYDNNVVNCVPPTDR